MGGVLTGFAIIAVVIAVGFVIGRIGVGGPDARQTLQLMAFFVASPALLFEVLARADLSIVFSAFMGVAALSAVGMMLVYVVVNAVFWRKGLASTTIGAMASGYVNANNIGLPVAVYVLGDAQYVAPLLLLQLVVMTPVALAILDVQATGGFSAKAILTRPLRNPMIIASFAGLIVALTGVTLPDAVYAPFELIGGAAVPLMLIAFGMSLSGERPFRAGTGRVRIVVASTLKSVFMPLVAYLLAAFVFHLEGHALFAAVALAALPTAQNIFNHASRYDVEVPLARDVVLVTTVAAVPVLIVVSALLA